MGKGFQLQTVFQNDYLKVEVDQAIGLLHGKWHLHPDSSTFRDQFQKIVAILLDSRSRYWLADDRALQYILFSDQTWIMTEMVPLLTTSQVVRFARIISRENILLQDASRVIGNGRRMNMDGGETIMEEFTDKDVALDWLFSTI